METLGQYLERIMRQKELSPKDVARACGITNSYIGRIIKGKGGNVSVATIVALAEGLDVDPHEVFTAASGKPPTSEGGVDPLLVVDTIQKLMLNPKGLELLRDWLSLTDKNRETIAEFLKSFPGKQPKRKKPRRK
jgi:transcriptional regulator with XRE-family HTH domain